MEAGHPAEGRDDAAVEATAADSRVAEIDHGVPAGVQPGHRGPDGHGLASADLAGDDAEGPFADAPVNACDRFGVGVVAVQHLRRKAFAERGFREPVVRFQLRDHAGTAEPASVSLLSASASGVVSFSSLSGSQQGRVSWPGTCASGRSEYFTVA